MSQEEVEGYTGLAGSPETAGILCLQVWVPTDPNYFHSWVTLSYLQGSLLGRLAGLPYPYTRPAPELAATSVQAYAALNPHY